MSKNRKKKNTKSTKRKAAHSSTSQSLRKLRRVFGENSTAMMRLASEGATPSEIAERLQMEQSEVERFVEAFAQLPCGMDVALLRSPSLLSKHKEMKSILKTAMRSARRIG